MTQPTFATQSLDHLGIVAGVCDRIGLVDTIEKRKVSVGESVGAMILSALGFVSRPLYLTPEFFSNKPMDLLLFFRQFFGKPNTAKICHNFLSMLDNSR